MSNILSDYKKNELYSPIYTFLAVLLFSFYSYIHDGSVMNIEIKKYHSGVLNSTSSYSYVTNNDMSTMRAYMTGYQSNVDYISSQYAVYYEP